VAISKFKTEIAFSALKEAFQSHYRIELGATPTEQAVTIVPAEAESDAGLFAGRSRS
jgi:hypothetical protein